MYCVRLRKYAQGTDRYPPYLSLLPGKEGATGSGELRMRVVPGIGAQDRLHTPWTEEHLTCLPCNPSPLPLPPPRPRIDHGPLAMILFLPDTCARLPGPLGVRGRTRRLNGPLHLQPPRPWWTQLLYHLRPRGPRERRRVKKETVPRKEVDGREARRDETGGRRGSTREKRRHAWRKKKTPISTYTHNCVLPVPRCPVLSVPLLLSESLT